MSKICSHLVDEFYIDKKSVMKVHEMSLNSRKTRIVLMPIYKSYGDPLLLHYISNFYDFEQGFIFGNYEDSPKLSFIDRFLKGNGHFLIKRDPRNSLSNKRSYSNRDLDIMNYVNHTLFQEVLENNVVTTLFQNDERIRSGKFSMPIYPEMSIQMLLKAHKKMQSLKYDIKIVPVCVNYDRIFDHSYLATEMISG